MIWIVPLIFVLVAGYIFWWNSNENKAIPIPMPLTFSKKLNEFFRIPFSSEIPSHDPPLSLVTR